MSLKQIIPNLFGWITQRVKGVRISVKIFMPFIVGLVFLAAAFAYLVINYEKEKNLLVQNVDSAQQIINISNQVVDLQKQVEQEILTYRYDHNSNILELLNQQSSQMSSLAEKFGPYLSSTEGRQLLDDYLASKASAVKLRQDLFSVISDPAASTPDKIDRAYAAWQAKGQEVDRNLDRIVAFGSGSLDQDLTAGRKIIEDLLLAYISTLMIIILLVVLLYIYLTRLIVNPIKRLTDGARRIAEGDLDWAIQSASSDEIGNLAKAFNDMTQKLRGSYADLHSLAFSDSLTGLPNRQAMEHKLQAAISLSKETNTSVGVLLMDLDRFKNINDTFGHDVGDSVLKGVAARLTATLRPYDTVIRLGGDEFLIILPGIKTAHGSVVVAEKILRSLEESISIDGRELYINSSLGVAIYPNDGEDVSGILKAADIALYGAKASGRNRYNLYNKITDLRPLFQMELENDLHVALKKDQLKVFYQPLMNLQTDRPIAVEALLRWQHPNLGLLLPYEFVSLAEECGAINSIGPWALKTACEAVSGWEEKGLLPVELAVNLSPRQFLEDGLVNDISKVLSDTDFPPARLTLEITENLAMTNLERSKEKLRELSRLGMAVSIDDFGTGYSSLSYLKNFPVNRIKIDHSFIRSMITDPQDTAIVKAIITMGHNLNLAVAAEGVETDTQLALLKSLSCDEAQGFLLGRPMSEEDFGKWLENFGKPSVVTVQEEADVAGKDAI